MFRVLRRLGLGCFFLGGGWGKCRGVTPDTVTGWELNRHKPSFKFAKVITEFLGYFPFKVDGISQ